jgi:hypothetical protein
VTPARWVGAVVGVLVLAWVVLALSPFVALYRLAAAVQARDVPAVAARVNFRTLRVSLTRQALAAVVEAAGARRDLEPRDRQLVIDAAGGLVEPLIASLVTPETVLDLLDDGWPQAIALPPRETRGGGLPQPSLGQFARLVLSAESRGFRGIVVPVPPDRPRSEQLRLRLRLSGLTWRLVEVEVPAELRERLTQRLVRAGDLRRGETR